MANRVVHWEIGGSDLDRSSAFYKELFGWEPASFDENYRLIPLEDGVGGGLMKTMGGMPPYVTIYVEVDDLVASLAEAERLGGSTLVPPTPIEGVGDFALFSDPDGNTIGLLKMAAG